MVPLPFETSDDQGTADPLAPQTVRDKRVAAARKILGLKPEKEFKDASDQSDHSAAEERRTMDTRKVL